MLIQRREIVKRDVRAEGGGEGGREGRREERDGWCD